MTGLEELLLRPHLSLQEVPGRGAGELGRDPSLSLHFPLQDDKGQVQVWSGYKSGSRPEEARHVPRLQEPLPAAGVRSGNWVLGEEHQERETGHR